MFRRFDRSSENDPIQPMSAHPPIADTGADIDFCREGPLADFGATRSPSSDGIRPAGECNASIRQARQFRPNKFLQSGADPLRHLGDGLGYWGIARSLGLPKVVEAGKG